MWLLFFMALSVATVMAQTSNISIWNNVSMNQTNSTFSCDPNKTLQWAFYNGQNRRNSATVWGQDGYEFHYYNTTYITAYNPYNSLRTSASNAAVPLFQFRSKVLPITRPSGQGVYLTIQNDLTYLQGNNPRTQMAGQFVHYINRWRTQSFFGPNLPYAYRVDNGQFLNSPQISYSSRASNLTPYSTPLNVCHNFYIARCGDGIVDNKNKPGGTNTDGKQGINTVNGFMNWVDPSFSDEVCDDWANNGQVWYCNTTCTAAIPVPNPVCTSISLTPNSLLPNQSTNIVCNATNATSYSISVNGPGNPFNYILGNSVNYTPTIPGNYTVSCTAFGPQGTTPSTCTTQTLTVVDNSPQCEQFTATPQIVWVGQPVTLFCDGNQYSNTYQILVQNASNNGLIASFNGWLPAPNNNVTATWTPNAPGTYTTQCAVSNNNTQVDYCPNQIIVVGQPDLWIDKTANQTGVVSWANITFTLTFWNSGNSVANNVTIQDVLPVNLQYVSHNLNGVQWWTSFNGQTVFGYSAGFSGLTLQPGQSGTMTITATYVWATCPTGIINYGTVYNQTDQANDTALFDCIPPAPANIVLDKKQHVTGNPTDANITVASWNTITYTIVVTNNGGTIQTGIYLEDVLPTNTTYSNSSIAGLPWLTTSHAAGIVTSSVFALAPGQTVTWIITATINTGSGAFLNTAYIKHINGSIIAQDSVLATGVGPALTLDKYIINPQSYYLPGDTIIYGITFSNTGSGPAYDVIIQDVLPGAVTYISSSITPNLGTFMQSIQGGSTVISYGSFTLNPGQIVTVIITGVVNTNINNNTLNTAIVQSSNHPTLTDTADFVSQPSPTIQKQQQVNGPLTSNQITVNLGDTISYQVVFGNNGGSTANGVVISDTLPIGLTYVSSSLNVAYTNTTNNLIAGQTVVSYNGITLAVGQQAVLTVVAQVSSAIVSSYTNTARVEFFNPYQTASASVVAIRVPSANVNFTKILTTNQSVYEAGDAVNFALQFTNIWPDAVTNISLQDIWPSCLNFVSWTSTPTLTQTSSNTPYVRTYPSLTAGQSITLNLNGTVKNDPNCTGIHTNTGRVTYSVGGNQFTLERTVQFEIVVPEPAQCQNLSTNTSTITLNNNGGNGWAQLTCTTANNIAGNISIDCGNGTSSQTVFGTSLVYTCLYNQTHVGNTYTTQCIIDSVPSTNISCQKPISITQGSFGICGNGIKEGLEQCDITNSSYANGINSNGRYIIGNRLDNGFNSTNNYQGSYCEYCAIKNQTQPFVYTPPACFYVDSTISIQKDEILPFWRSLQQDGTNITQWNTCTQPNSIPRGTMQCTFSFYAPNELNPGSELDTFTTPCFGNSWGNNVYFDYFNSTFADSLSQAMGRYYRQLPANINRFGEHKVVLEKVEYKYCDNNQNFIPNPQRVDRVCEVNFAVTRPYLVQKSAFSNTPQTTTINLSNFYAMNGSPISSLTDLSSIMVLNESQYTINPNTNLLMHNFVSKYKQLAVVVNDPAINALFSNAGQIKVSKVPGQQIYIFESQGATRITLKEMAAFTKPFTMIVDGMDLVVEWSLTTTNGMFLVKGGKISFKEPTNNVCQTRQVVNGVFITDQWFGVVDPNLIINNTFGKPRCNEWWLTIKWVLIGQGLDQLVAQRRSHLNTWFWITSTSDAGKRAERRNKIFDGAAVLIEYNPALRQSLPPGMNEFTQVLDVYKN